MGVTADVTAVGASTSSVTIFAGGPVEELIVVNDGTGNLYVRYGTSAASVSDYSVKLAPGDALIDDHYEGALHGIWDATGGYARVTTVS
jgi:hypothetical protein